MRLGMKIEYIGISDERKEEAQIRLCIKSGSANDVAGKEGTAHLLEHINLLFDKLGKYGSRNDLKATGYTDFFNTTYVFDTVDDAIHIYRVFEIINRIIDGWFINQYDINLAKQDIKKEISEIDVNPIVKKIIEGSQLERKDPRNKQVNVDNITIDDIYQYLHKNYEKNNCLILIESGLPRQEIEEGAELLFPCREDAVKDNSIFLNWNDFNYKESKNVKGIIFKLKKTTEQYGNGFWEVKWIQWILEQCFIDMCKGTPDGVEISEMLFSPYEFLFGIFDDSIYWNENIKEKIGGMLKGCLDKKTKDSCYQILISRAKSDRILNQILVREKEYIYNRKLILNDWNDVFQQINEMNIHKMIKYFEEILYNENILLLD